MCRPYGEFDSKVAGREGLRCVMAWETVTLGAEPGRRRTPPSIGRRVGVITAFVRRADLVRRHIVSAGCRPRTRHYGLETTTLL